MRIPIFNSQDKAVHFLKIFYVVGITGMLFTPTQYIFLKLTPVSLILVSAILLYYHPEWETKHIVLFVFIALTGFFTEVAGVNSGKIFGAYSYGPTLGFKLFNTPLIIGLNWLLLIYCIHSIVSGININVIVKIIIASLLMIVYDLLLEPAAQVLNMWNWNAAKAPMQNYFAWFAISVLFFSLLYMFRIRFYNPVAFVVFVIQLAFFGIIDLYYHFIS